MIYLYYLAASVVWFFVQLVTTTKMNWPIYEKLGAMILGVTPEPGDGAFHALVGLVLMMVVSVLLGFGTVKLIQAFRAS
jgi:ABC-type phosphate transport system permease subunit